MRSARGPLVALVVFVLLVVLLEAGARAALALGDPPVATNFALADVWDHGEKDFHEPDAELGWRPVPGYRDINVRLDAHGMRGPGPSEAPPGRRRVLLLGDSCTFGYAVAEEAVFATVLGSLLGTRTEVLNAGVIGYTSHQGLLLFARLARELRPDVVVFGFGYNDHHSARFSDAEKVALAERSSGWFQETGVARWLARRRGDPILRAEPVPRVSVEQFRANALELQRRAETDGARALFWTVPLRPNLPLVENFARVERDGKVVWMRQIDLAAGALGEQGRAGLRAHFVGGQGPDLAEVLAKPRNVVAIDELAKAHPDLPIFPYLQSLSLARRGQPVGASGTRWRELDQERTQFERYNDVLRGLAGEGRIEIVDAARAFEEEGRRAPGSAATLFLDVVHPTAKGHALLARLLAERLAE